MTSEIARRRLSPRMVREASFSQRRRGLDETQVRRLLEEVADQLEAGDAERARLRAENETLRRRLDDTSESAAINPQAIALFSQAQQVADNLVAEAVDHARTLMLDARKQQREILATARTTAAPEVHEHGGNLREVEYVRTFAKVAQVQLRSVLEALTEQVDRLGDVPVDQGPPSEGAVIDGPVQWRFERSGAPAASGP